MSFRVFIPRTAAAISLALRFCATANAEESVAGEVKALRQIVEQQGRQIDQLTAQIARLQGRGDTPADASATASHPAPADNADFAIPAARAVPPHPPANVHIVVKGESLEKIAKSHGTTVPDLQKINRIPDPKKLQIGQQIVLPPPNPKKEGP